MHGMEVGLEERLWMTGNLLGSNVNDECKIDSIAQSWAIISKAGDLDKVTLAMQSLEERLVDKKIRYYQAFRPSL